MKEKLKQLFHSEMTIGIICGAVSLVLIVSLLLTVILMGNKKEEETGDLVSSSTKTQSEFVFQGSASEMSSLVSTDVSDASNPTASSKSLSQTVSTPAGDRNTSSKNTSSQLQAPPKADRNNPKELAAQNKYRAKLLAQTFYKDFYNDENKYLLDTSPSKDLKLATAWGYGDLMAMQCMMAKIDKNEIPLMRSVIDGLAYYGKPREDGSLFGYMVERGPRPMTAGGDGLAYDDNIWIAINFIQAYENTKDKAYLQKAEYIMNFLWEEAWFEPLGGFFWDYRHDARHSCSNNPAIKPYVDLYKITGKKVYLDRAKKVYDFSYNALKDKDRNIYEDLVKAHKLEDGTWVEGSSKNTGFYTYNTGAMISGASALYGVTKEKKYLDEALACAKGAYEYFGRKDQVKGLVGWPGKDTQIWFNAILLRGYIDLYPYAKTEATKYIMMFQDSIDYCFDKYYMDGYIPYDWLGGWSGDARQVYKPSMDQSTNIEVYAMLADWQSRRS